MRAGAVVSLYLDKNAGAYHNASIATFACYTGASVFVWPYRRRQAYTSHALDRHGPHRQTTPLGALDCSHTRGNCPRARRNSMTASGRKFAAFPTSRVATAGVVHPAGRHNYAPSHLPCASPITTSWVRGALTHNRLDMPLSVSITNSAAVRRSLPNARVGLWLTSARPRQRHVGIKHSNVGGLASALAVGGGGGGGWQAPS